MRERSFEIIPREHPRVRETFERIGSDVVVMEALGRNIRERNEYVFERLEKMERRALVEQGGFDLFRGLKKMAGDKIAGALGVQPGFLRDVISNFVAGLGIADLRAMFQPGACTKIVTKLGGAIQGALVDQLAKLLGLTPGSFITIAITEAIKSGFVESGPFVKMASKNICNLNISDTFKNFFKGKGEEKAQATAEVQAAAAGAAAGDAAAAAVPAAPAAAAAAPPPTA
jgi:hypothetical protein